MDPLAKDPQNPEPIATQLLEKHETKSRLLNLINELPKNQREVLQLKIQGELSYKEISRVTGLSTGNIGRLIHHAMVSLKEQFEALNVKGA